MCQFAERSEDSTRRLGILEDSRRSRLEVEMYSADNSTTSGVGVGRSEENVWLRRGEGAQASEECLGTGKGGDDPPKGQTMQRRRRVITDKGEHGGHNMVTDTTAQHKMPGRCGKITQNPEKRVGSRKSEETPEVGESEEGKVAQANRQPRPLGGEGRAEVPRTNDTGEHDMVRRHANNETTTEGGPPKLGPTQT